MDKTGHQGIQATQLEYHLNIIQDKYKKEFSDHFTENLENSLKEADLQLQNFVSKSNRPLNVLST